MTKNRYLYIIASYILATFLLLSCAKDGMVPVDNGSKLAPDGRILLSLSAQTSIPDRIQTKATSVEEDRISNVYVLVFDDSHKLSQAPAEAFFDGSKYKTSLAPNPAVQNIYVLANLSQDHKTALGGLLPGVSTYDDLRAIMVTEDATELGISTPFPMCSAVIQSVISPSMGGKTAILERIVARLDVNASSLNSATFTLESVTLLNAAVKGFLLSGLKLPSFSGAGEVVRYNEQVAADNRVASAIYCYENSGVLNDQTTANPTRVLVKGRYKNGASGYYLLHVVYKPVAEPNGDKRYDINRNVIYTVNITGVDSPGYLTETEALANKPTNDIEYNVTVTDPNAHDILSNGDYFLGFSNSDCLVFSSEEATNLTVAILTHNASASVTSRNVSVSGTELSLVGNPLLSEPNTPTPVVVNLGRNFSSGTLTFRLGNLEKTIFIDRLENSLSFGGVLPLGPDYVFGEILHTDPQAENWLKFSEEVNGTMVEGKDEIVSEIGREVYVVFDHNIIMVEGTSRDKYEEAYLSRGHQSGRTKAIFYQHAYNMIKLDGKPIANSVVATFHRHNQVGERIVKMANPKADEVWIVEVVAGRDFIKIAPGMNANPDPNLGTENFNDAENYPVEGELTQLMGTSNEILFRIGMKGTIDPTQNRYGLILVTHAQGSNRIFVRQGEAADYIMRESDPMQAPASVTSPNRPDVVMFSPFNLTDPQGRLGRVDFSTGGGTGDFTNYPSQSGYLFQSTGPYAWPPIGKVSNDWKTASGSIMELCPEGYRRPKDGNSGSVIDSEIRQSLWYNPTGGTWSSDVENILQGKMADGYFDRQTPISPIEGETHGLYYQGNLPLASESIVGNGTQIGVSGQVIFNPSTFASIFIPAAGFRSAFNSGNLTNLGVDASIWSGTLQGEGQTWVASMLYFGGKFTFDNEVTGNSNGFTIRCVKKRQGEP